MTKKTTSTTTKAKESQKTNEANDTTTEHANKGAQVQLMKIYVKDASLQVPQGIKAFSLEWAPELNVELNTQSKPLAEQNLHEVALKVKCTVKCKGEVAFITEVDQAGLFMINGLDEASLRHALGAFCPNILYPFLREAIGDMVTRAGFPQLNLSPINFDVVYQQQTAPQQAQKIIQ